MLGVMDEDPEEECAKNTTMETIVRQYIRRQFTSGVVPLFLIGTSRAEK